MSIEFFGLFVYLSGFIVGLGAVTVIDMLGFCAIKSSYFTEATIRAHKITKPLIWLGMTLALIGGTIFYSQNIYSQIELIQALIGFILVLNGIFLSFYISPLLLKKEQEEGSHITLLDRGLQSKIAISFIISFLGWWSSVLLLIYYLLYIK